MSNAKRLFKLCCEFAKFSDEKESLPSDFHKSVELLKKKKDSFIIAGMEDMWEDDLLERYESLVSGESDLTDEERERYYPGWKPHHFAKLVEILKAHKGPDRRIKDPVLDQLNLERLLSRR